MKRVLLIVPSNRGTIAKCSANLYKSLLETDIVLKCIIVYKNDNGIECFENCDYCYDNRSKQSFFYQKKWLMKIKKEFNPDISISTLNNCTILNVLTNIHEKKIGVFHAPYTQSKIRGTIFYIITILSYMFLFCHLTKLFCVSKEVKKSIINNFKSINKEKVSVVYNIHDIHDIINKSEEKISNAEYEKIFKNKNFLFCGRLDKNKAPERLLEAYILNKEKLNDYGLVYIGDDTDNMSNVLRVLAEKNNVGEKLHILGRQNNPYWFMKKSLALISCSYSEGLPGVIIESLILNTPVITTNSSEGVWEILECDDSYKSKLKGIYVAPKGIIVSNETKETEDIISLSKALCLIANDYEKFKLSPFSFIEKIKSSNVVKSFINI